jgi:hypothetical protein
MEPISSYAPLATTRSAHVIATHSCEDLLALKLVQLRRRLLEVESGLVTGSGHVCACGEVQAEQRTEKVGDLRSPKLAPAYSALADAREP